MKITGNEPANFTMDSNGTNMPELTSLGLTIRQQFAMAAMQGMCANSAISEAAARLASKHGKNFEQIVAANSVYMSDCLIDELNRTEADNV